VTVNWTDPQKQLPEYEDSWLMNHLLRTVSAELAGWFREDNSGNRIAAGDGPTFEAA
jgi:hypothetical protein